MATRKARFCAADFLIPALLGTGVLASGAAPVPQAPADAVYRNGKVYTADAHDSVQQAIAVKSGKLVFVGSDSDVQQFIGPATIVEDLRGRVLMPGLIDGHMHPLAGGATLLKCNLNYEPLTIGQMHNRIQECLNRTRNLEPEG